METKCSKDLLTNFWPKCDQPLCLRSPRGRKTLLVTTFSMEPAKNFQYNYKRHVEKVFNFEAHENISLSHFSGNKGNGLPSMEVKSWKNPSVFR